VVGGGKLTITWAGLLGTGTGRARLTVSFLIASLAFTGTELDERKSASVASARRRVAAMRVRRRLGVRDRFAR